MKIARKFLLSALFWSLAGSNLLIITPAFGGIPLGSKAPTFELSDAFGQSYDLAEIGDHSLIVLYFFDIRATEGRTYLNKFDKLLRKYNNSAFVFWGITQSSAGKVRNFVTEEDLQLPVLIDTGEVSGLYHAQIVHPIVYIIGPDLQVLDYFQGGGKTTMQMLTRLAARLIDRNLTEAAKDIGLLIEDKNLGNNQAKAITAYATLKEGDSQEAEQLFKKLSQQNGDGEILGKEGLAAVAALKGDGDKALALADEVERKAPDRGYAHVIKGDVLYSRGKKDAAEIEYNKAINKTMDEPGLMAMAYNQLGRLRASQGNYESARKLYDQATAVDPYFIEATSNKGMTYEREGNYQAALEQYRKALMRDNDIHGLIKSMQNASVAFNTPRSMNLNDVVIINLILDMNKAPEELKQAIDGMGEKQSAIIKVAGRMQAELIAEDFNITSIRPEIQVISSSDITKWEWEIRPQKTGNLTLYLSLNALFEVNGTQTPKSVQTFRNEIDIEVTWFQHAVIFWLNHWQWIITTVLIPVLVLMWRQYKKSYQ